MKRLNVLRHSANILNYESVGFGIHAMVELTAPSHIAVSLKQELLVRPEVLAVSVIAGDGLRCLGVIAVDMAHLHGFVRSLQKSGDTSTKIIFAEEKSKLRLVKRMRLLDEEKQGASYRELPPSRDRVPS